MTKEEFDNLDLEEQKEFLKDRAIRFFDRYSSELDSIRQLLEIKLNQIAIAYTIQNKIPLESVKVTTRVKTLKSFLKKLEKNNWSYFYYPTEISTDLIGARIVCWFLNDCYGVFDYIKSSRQMHIKPDSIKDYIQNPKPSGYRSLHLLTDISYDRVKNENDKVILTNNDMVCEVQIRTKLQDVFGDLTHEFHYKDGQDFSKVYQKIEAILVTQAHRLDLEDKAFMTIRDIYSERENDKKNREGFTDEK